MWPKRGMRREEDVEGARSDWLIKLTNKVSKIETNGEFFFFSLCWGTLHVLLKFVHLTWMGAFRINTSNFKICKLVNKIKML